jgi:hypothetical protein
MGTTCTGSDGTDALLASGDAYDVEITDYH